jgi:hypothetical protein
MFDDQKLIFLHPFFFTAPFTVTVTVNTVAVLVMTLFLVARVTSVDGD